MTANSGNNNGATSGNGSGAGAGAAFFLVFLGFFLPNNGPATARQAHNKAKIMIHCQMGKNEPREPDCSEPELAVEPEESLFMTPVRSEFEAKEFNELTALEEPTSESLDPEEESQGVTVVVVIWNVATTVGSAACAAARRVSATNVLMATQRLGCSELSTH